MANIQIAILKEAMDYDPMTGHLTWKTRPVEHFKSAAGAKRWNIRFPGRRVGSVVGNGYLMFGMQGKMHYNHRVAFALHHGRYPEGEVDHIDAVKTNNAASNLRDCTREQNGANTVFKFTTKRGTKRHRGKFVAQMSLHNRNLYLGIFDTEDAAHRAFRAAAKRIRGEFAQLTHSRD